MQFKKLIKWFVGQFVNQFVGKLVVWSVIQSVTWLNWLFLKSFYTLMSHFVIVSLW